MGKKDSLFTKRNKYQELSFELLELNRKIRDYQNKIEEMKMTTAENEKKMDEMKSDFTILICISPFHNGEEKDYVYYDADLKRARTSNNTPLNADIDLHEFFTNYTKSDDRRLIYAHHHPARIMEYIIDDMFSKKEYKSWSEVKEDLLNLEETYRRPFVNEWPSDYYRNVICKTKTAKSKKRKKDKKKK